MLTRRCLIVLVLCLDLCWRSGFCAAHAHGDHEHRHCNHGHHDHHDHDQQSHPHHHNEQHDLEEQRRSMMLPEELAEEEDMRLYGFGPYHGHDDHQHEHEHPQLTGLGLWLNALGCSLLVSLASLICLVILPVIFIQGKPSKAVVDSLALFGAGAMLGDAFLHQLPHAFGGEHSHSHGHHAVHFHDEHSGHGQGHGHAHSIKELSVGLSVLGGIVLFLLVEKIVRYVEENSGRAASGHHHHSKKKLKDDDNHDNPKAESPKGNESVRASNGDTAAEPETLRKRKASTLADDKPDADCGTPPAGADDIDKPSVKENDAQSPSSLVFGYLNLFSDGVHNFTDGVALGSAFLLYGSVGGWSRTLFLLAHELPQEVGDFGILVRSGFSVSKALFFNFLSALVALAGTAVALLLGKDPGQSSLIEGFTAGGFIYIAVAGVLAEMNGTGRTTLRSTTVQLISLTFGMGIAFYISLKE